MWCCWTFLDHSRTWTSGAIAHLNYVIGRVRALGPLVRLRAVGLDSVQDLLVNEPETFARQRAAFYSLATWARAASGTSG